MSTINSISAQIASLGTLKTHAVRIDRRNGGADLSGDIVASPRRISGASNPIVVTTNSAPQGLNVTAGPALTQAPKNPFIQQVLQAFKLIDTDHDNFVTQEELSAYCAQQMDAVSNDPNMTASEKFIAIGKIAKNQMAAQEVFDQYKGADGRVNIKEALQYAQDCVDTYA